MQLNFGNNIPEAPKNWLKWENFFEDWRQVAAEVFSNTYMREGGVQGESFSDHLKKGKNENTSSFSHAVGFRSAKVTKPNPPRKRQSHEYIEEHTLHTIGFKKPNGGKCFSTCCKLVNKTMLPTKLFVRSVWTSWGFLPKKRLSKKGPA